MDATPTVPGESDLGSYIRQRRKAANITQSKLADEVGIDVTYLSKLENGRQGASETVLRSLAAALDVSAARMLMLAGRVPDELRSALVIQANESVRVTTTEVITTTRLLAPPRYLTHFTDRVQEIAHFKEVNQPGALITIVGPPGCGKSRFAAEVTGRLEKEKGLATTWLPVQEGNDADHIRALLVAGETSPGSVVVLDNADLSLEASVEVARRLLHGSSGVTVIATSRQPLDINGEQLLPLRGLPIPDPHLRPSADGDGPTPDLEKLLTQESLSLFVGRAKLVQPGFQLDLANAAAVFDICQWLDGLPLAIELAALRLRHMTVVDLAAQLDEPRMLTLLVGTARDVPDRHASLESAIGWSFDRLSEEQRTVAVRLSRFATPFRPVDAADVAADELVTRERVDGIVMQLVDRSLLLAQPDRNRRAVYKWPRPIQQFGLRELRLSADFARTQQRYEALCRRFVESLADQRSLSEADWIRLADLSPDMFTVIEAMPAAERRQALEAMSRAWPSLLRFGNPGSLRLAERLSEHVHERQMGVIGEPGIQARVRGDFAAAHDHYRAAYEHATNESNPLAHADTLLSLAQVAVDQGRYDDAEENARQAGELFARHQLGRGLIEVINLQGTLCLVTSNYREAEDLFLRALDLAQKEESRRLEAYSLHNLGLCDCVRRRIASARGRLEQSLGIRDHMHNLRGVTRVIETFALVESEVENYPVALQLLGAALQYRSSSQMLGVPAWWRRRLDRLEEDARSALAAAPGEAERFLRLGAAMSLQEASELAMREVSAPFTDPLGDLRSSSLRRRAPEDCRPADVTARALVESRRGDPKTTLELAIEALRDGKDVAATVRKEVRDGELFALAEHNGGGFDDLLCFSVSPDLHRGIVVPLFSRAATMGALLERNQDWSAKQVVSVRFDQLRATLTQGETVVVDPWSPSEYRWTVGDDGYLPDESLTTT